MTWELAIGIVFGVVIGLLIYIVCRSDSYHG